MNIYIYYQLVKLIPLPPFFVIRSWELKEEYDRLRTQYETAVDGNAFALNKKRGISMEVKQYRQQKEEAEQFTQLVQERLEMSARYLLWKLYHVEKKAQDMENEANNKRLAANDATDEQVNKRKTENGKKKHSGLTGIFFMWSLSLIIPI